MTAPRFEVECQDGCPIGTWHQAEFHHMNGERRVYAVVCGPYVEMYTDEVVREIRSITPLATRPVDALSDRPFLCGLTLVTGKCDLPEGHTTRGHRSDRSGL